VHVGRRRLASCRVTGDRASARRKDRGRRGREDALGRAHPARAASLSRACARHPCRARLARVLAPRLPRSFRLRGCRTTRCAATARVHGRSAGTWHERVCAVVRGAWAFREQAVSSASAAARRGRSASARHRARLSKRFEVTVVPRARGTERALRSDSTSLRFTDQTASSPRGSLYDMHTKPKRHIRAHGTPAGGRIGGGAGRGLSRTEHDRDVARRFARARGARRMRAPERVLAPVPPPILPPR